MGNDMVQNLGIGISFWIVALISTLNYVSWAHKHIDTGITWHTDSQ